MKLRHVAALVLAASVPAGGHLACTRPAWAQTPPPHVGGAGPLSGCEREDFVAVVEEAAGVLRKLNHEQRPIFQERLRELKEKRGWSHDKFMAEAVPFVQDEKIAAYDSASADLLDKINSLGETGSAAAKPDCAVLIDLRAYMKALVDTQKSKWEYMFGKLDAALKN
jgi:hypothetical protein